MLLESFGKLKEIIIMAILFYFFVIIILRTSIKKTLSDISIFDFLVTATIGPIIANTIISPNTEFLDGLAAVSILLVLQYIMSKLDYKYEFISKILKSKPKLVYYDGAFLEDNMKKMRITREEIIQEARSQAGLVIEDIDAVVLESNGEVSIIEHVPGKDRHSLREYL